MRRFAFVTVAVLLVASPLPAQVLYGTVSGMVVDAGGQPLPGVAVTLAGPAMLGPRVTASDTAGRFRIVPVPPGERYTLLFQLAGFATLESTEINVNIGEDTAVYAEMPLAEFAETLAVTADGLVVDTTRSTTSYAVEYDLLDSVVNDRHYRVALEMSPGVLPANNPFVNGSSNDANRYLVDGVDTTDPRTQTWAKYLVWDTIAEAQVQTAGFAAEYGRATGGILNLVTRSGGNAFAASARLLRTDDGWSARNGVEGETGGRKSGGHRDDELRPVATLGGPIVEDALWFYLAYEGRDLRRSTRHYATAADAVAGAFTDYWWTGAGHYSSGKLTWQPGPNHNLVGFYNEDPSKWGPVRCRWCSASTSTYNFVGGHDASLQWTGVLSPAVLVEAKAQRHRQELDYEPASATWNTVPYVRDLGIGYWYGGAGDEYASDRYRDGLLLTGSCYLDAEHGPHELKAGVELLGLRPKTGTIYNELGYYRVRSGEPLFFDQWTNQTGSTHKDQDYSALFVQDQWRIGRLTVNAGLRAEQVETFNNVGDSIVKFSFADMLAPRLGLAYDLAGDVVRGSIGRFYQMPSNYISDYFQVTTDVFSRYQWNGFCTVDGRDVWTYDPSCWTVAFSFPWALSGTLDPDLEPGYVDELTLGFEKRLSDRLAAGINFVWREQKTAIDFYDPTGYGYYYVTNVPQRARRDYPEANLPDKVAEYRGIMLDLRKRLGPDGLQFMASYTYAWRDHGWQSPWGGFVGGAWRAVGALVFTSPEFVNRWWYGRSSSPHLLKVFGSYTFPSRTVVGVSAYWSSGNVYTPASYAESITGYPNPLAERGSLRVGNNWEADLYLEQGIDLGPVSLALYVNVFNVFNNQQAIERGAIADYPATFKLPTAWQDPRQVQLGLKIEY